MFGFYTGRFVNHLQAEVAFWREQYRHERQRAELLTDRLLHKEHVAPVTAPLISDVPMAFQDGGPLTMEQVQKAAAEWASVGEAAVP